MRWCVPVYYQNFDGRTEESRPSGATLAVGTVAPGSMLVLFSGDAFTETEGIGLVLGDSFLCFSSHLPFAHLLSHLHLSLLGPCAIPPASPLPPHCIPHDASTILIAVLSDCRPFLLSTSDGDGISEHEVAFPSKPQARLSATQASHIAFSAAFVTTAGIPGRAAKSRSERENTNTNALSTPVVVILLCAAFFIAWTSFRRAHSQTDYLQSFYIVLYSFTCIIPIETWRKRISLTLSDSSRPLARPLLFEVPFELAGTALSRYFFDIPSTRMVFMRFC
ncbi:hypothetical protein C8R47DRAFT_1219680 [Mycena vitilis]|nr:hypothetical protein C8R47DRAFT_1219680 [Mycena vitilis]